jgi:tetratricopeptide (TPR) repeat protein
MKIFSAIILSLTFYSCQFNVELKKNKQYFDDSTSQIIKKGSDAYLKGDYKLSDSLLTLAISNSKNINSRAVPEWANPYFYRGNNDIQLGKYDQALYDMDHVTSDTTTNTHVLIVICEAFRMLKKYDSCISICNRLISLKFDSMILSERGVCYYHLGQIDKACSDLTYCKQKGLDTAYLNPYMKDCK